MQFYVLPAKRMGRCAVYRSQSLDRPSRMALHYIGTPRECQMFIETHDADQLAQDITSQSEAYWDAVDARLSRRAGY